MVIEKEQLDAWAAGQADLKKWNQSLQEHSSIDYGKTFFEKRGGETDCKITLLTGLIR